MYWKNKIKNINNVVEGEVQTIVFKANKGIPPIVSMNPSCGCAKPVYNSNKMELIVKFMPKKVPLHLNTDSYLSTNKINIYYHNQPMDQLIFKCRINKKRK